MSLRILVVGPNATETAAIERALVAAGYRVTVVPTFKQAIRQVSMACPNLVVVAARLEAFSGLHLLLRCRVDYPNLPVTIVGTTEDFTPDIGRYGGRFLATPVDGAALVQLISEMLEDPAVPGGKSRRKWPRKSTELSAIVHEAHGRVVELGYGGLRVEMRGPREPIPDALDITFPTLGLSVTAVPRWSKQSIDGGFWWFGAEISTSTEAWREMVDSQG